MSCGDLVVVRVVGDTVGHPPAMACCSLHRLVLVGLLVGLGHGHLQGVNITPGNLEYTAMP